MEQSLHFPIYLHDVMLKYAILCDREGKDNPVKDRGGP
jgi:hypothetical protein